MHHCLFSLFFETITFTPFSLLSSPTSDVLPVSLRQYDYINAAMVHICALIQFPHWPQHDLLFSASVREALTNKFSKISSKDRNATSTPDPALVVGVSTFTDELMAVLPPTTAQVPLPPNAIATAEPVVVIPATRAQVPLSPSVVASNGSATT